MADDVTIPKGSGGEFYFELTDANGDPVVDFTGWTASAQLRSHRGIVADDPDTSDVNESNLLHTFSTRFENSRIYLEYTAAQTAAWDFLRAVGDIKIDTPTEEPVYPKIFYVWVRPSVSE